MLLKYCSLHIVAMGDFFMKQDLTVTGVYIAAVIGAGFASGSEIVHYFAVYGKISIFGILLSSILFGVIAWAVLEYSKSFGADTFGEFMRIIFPPKAAKFINALTIIFMFSVFTAMIAGSGETVSELIGVKKSVGVVIILAVTVIILIFDVRGLMAANGVMSVLITAGVLGVCFYLFNFREIGVFGYKGKWLVSGAVYTGYNILTAGAVLPPMAKFVKNPKRTGIISGAIIFVLLSSLWGIISIYYGKIPLGAIPMLTLCKRHAMSLGIIYSGILFMAMLTTALANGFALVDIMPGGKWLRIGALAALGFFFSGFSFDFFVGSIYRWAGYVGVILMLVILIKFPQKNKLVRKIE